MRLTRGAVTTASAVALCVGSLGACSVGGDGPQEPVTIAGAIGPGADPFGTDAATIEAAEDAVANCMIEQGWEYIPFGIGPLDQGTPAQKYNWAYDEEVVRAQGLGIVGQYLNGGQGVMFGENVELVDPNTAYLETLTASEREAWNVALNGTEDEQVASMTRITFFDPSSGTEGTLFGSNAGCFGLAFDLIYGDMGQPDDVVAALRAQWDALQDTIEADPRTLALEATWVGCMRASGYNYESQDALWSSAYKDFTARADGIVGDGYEMDPTAGWSDEKRSEFFSSATEEEIAALYAGPASTLSEDQRARLEALQAEETALALAARACTVANQEEAKAIAADVETRYVREHEAELAAIAASLAEQD